MPDTRHQDLDWALATIRDRARTGQTDRRAALADIERLASKLIDDRQAASTSTAAPVRVSPVIARREPAPEGPATVSPESQLTPEESRQAGLAPAIRTVEAGPVPAAPAPAPAPTHPAAPAATSTSPIEPKIEPAPDTSGIRTSEEE